MMRKTADRLDHFPPRDDTRPVTLRPRFEGQYRVRVYEAEGQTPVVIATDATVGNSDPAWLSNYAPHLAATVTREHLPSAETLYWITPYAAQDAGENLFERTLFAVFGDQVAYDARPRPSASPPLEPQGRLLTQADVEDMIGEPLV